MVEANADAITKCVTVGIVTSCITTGDNHGHN